jgi:uncharacterized protein YbaP (TraB family)
MKSLLFAAALAFAPVAAHAQNAAPPAPPAAAVTDADPAIWVVRDEDTTVYLFGTFHMLDGRAWFNDEVRTAFDASNELVLEAIIPDNPAELQPLFARLAIDPQGRLLSQRLTAEENAALAQALGNLGLPPVVVDRFEPWFASMMIGLAASQRLGIRSENGPELVLRRAAGTRNLPVHELEGVEWQLRLFDSMPEAQQLAQLRQTIEQYEEIDDQLAPVLSAWSTGDIEGMAAILHQSSREDPALHQLIFTNRNATWARWIRERMARPGTVFIAVGGGHLAGPDSVQAVLATHGLQAERVPHVEGN